LEKTVETVLIGLFATNLHHNKLWCWFKRDWVNTTIYCGVNLL